MKRVDQWLGLNVFHPPVIKFCQTTGINQFAVYRYIWWMVALWWLYRVGFGHWALTTFAILFAAGRTISVGYDPSRPSEGSRFLRFLFLLCLPIDLVAAVMLGKPTSLIQTVAVLVAEYALTIRTIPPRPTKNPTQRRTKAHA